MKRFLTKILRALYIIERPCCRNEDLVPNTPPGCRPNEVCLSCGMMRWPVKQS